MWALVNKHKEVFKRSLNSRCIMETGPNLFPFTPDDTTDVFCNLWQKVPWDDLDLFLVYFKISYLTATTQPLDTQNIWHCALPLLIKKTCDFRLPSFLVFLSLQTWEVGSSEMGWLGPILDLKLILLVPFFAAAIIAGHMKYWVLKIRQNGFPATWTFNLH